MLRGSRAPAEWQGGGEGVKGPLNLYPSGPEAPTPAWTRVAPACPTTRANLLLAAPGWEDNAATALNTNTPFSRPWARPGAQMEGWAP